MPDFKIFKAVLPADETTPLALYRHLRAWFSPSVLLESHNFEQRRHSRSVIGIDPLLELRVSEMDGRSALIRTDYVEAVESVQHDDTLNFFELIQQELNQLRYDGDPGPIDGLFGFCSFDAYRWVEPELEAAGQHPLLPDLHYFLFRFLIVFDHFHEKIEIREFCPQKEASELPRLLKLLPQPSPPVGDFSISAGEESNISAEEYEALVRKGIDHCLQGDTFQIVLSREFSQNFKGDDLAVYRQLRRLNPSPYMFYFDFGPYRLFGASPESLLKVANGKASMRPIAGTSARTGVETEDRERALALLADPKENAEHRMLVDLARNDLSRGAYPVKVDKLREVEYFSHLMHIVSEVSGEIAPGLHPFELYTRCFPAGTLSGAPKFKAVELIYAYEGGPRGPYGGGLGYISPAGGFDHCIFIRSAVSIGQTLYYRAGAGIVAASDPEKESAEVIHKTNAIRQAIALASEESMALHISMP